MSKLEELSLDVEELKTLLGKAERQRVKDFLSLEIRKIETELASKQAENTGNLDESPVKKKNPQPNNSSAAKLSTCYDVKLTNYAWDQSDKFVKIYVTLKNVHLIPKENVQCEFSTKSMDLMVSGLDGKNYTLLITNLMFPIIPDGSHSKIKTDMVIVFLKKESTAKNWSNVTQLEKKTKDAKVPKVEEGDDPSKSLMDLMKQMYDDGDDDMKRTIAKAWTESREKNMEGLGGAGGF